jgi:hypothetical protein
MVLMVDKFPQGFAKLLQRVEEQERGEGHLGFDVQCPSPPLPLYIGSRVAEKGCLSLQVQPEARGKKLTPKFYLFV